MFLPLRAPVSGLRYHGTTLSYTQPTRLPLFQLCRYLTLAFDSFSLFREPVCSNKPTTAKLQIDLHHPIYKEVRRLAKNILRETHFPCAMLRGPYTRLCSRGGAGYVPRRPQDRKKHCAMGRPRGPKGAPRASGLPQT